VLIFGVLLALAVATSPDCDARLVYAKSYAATGGSAWNGVAEISAQGSVSASGLTGEFQSHADTSDGRAALHERLGSQSTTTVYDGKTYWREDYSRGVHALDSPNARSAAITAAYLNRNGYYKPDFSHASIVCLGVRADRGRSYYVTRVSPAGGLPVEQWIDARSFLIDRTVETTPTSVSITDTSDYRQTGRLVLPYSIRQGQPDDPSDDNVRRVRSYQFASTVRTGDFVRPAYPTDTAILGTIPDTIKVSIEAGDIIVNALIDGKGPFPFILDTGGHAILTPEAAHAVGVQSQGAGTSGGGGSGRVGVAFAFVHRLQIGHVVIPDQPFLVIPYGNDFSDRGEKRPLAGILGLEIFERLAVQIDYAHSTMTMTPSGSFAYHGSGVRIPIVFQDDMPIAMAAADDIAGWFGVDTGNSGSPVMFGPFLKKHDFLKRYERGQAAVGSGTGGAVHSSVHTLARFRFAGKTLRKPLVYFVVGQRGGSFSSTTEAGNLGYQILANFDTTFDFRRGAMYVDPASRGPMASRGRAGLGLSKVSRDAFSVVSVAPESPASRAGIAVGDRIESVDGRPAKALGFADVYALMRQPQGTVLTFTVLHGATTRSIALTLRDLPPP
jgi:hypothetical protein